MRRPWTALFLLAATLALSPGPEAAAEDAPARADAAPKAEAAPGADAASDRAPRVRASHRVDVIAPGERVETVIDRFRTARPPAPRQGDAPPRGEGHGAPQHGGGDTRGTPGAGMQHDGAGMEHDGMHGAERPGTAPPATAPPGAAPAPGTAAPGTGVPSPGERSPGRHHR